MLKIEYVDFCQTEGNFVCAVESFFSVLPFVLFAILGFYSYRETRAITAYEREPWTWRHIIKLVFSGLLALISFAFILVYLLTEDNISMKTVLTWGGTCFLWVFNSILMRGEFEKLGFTTSYLRLAWIILFVCQTILLILGIFGFNTDTWQKVIVVYSLNEAFLAIMIFLGFFISDDYPNKKTDDLYSSIASDRGLEVDEEAYKALTGQMNFEEKRGGDNFKPFPIDNEERVNETLQTSGEVITRASQLEKNYRPSEGFSTGNALWRASNASIQMNLKEEIGSIENIEVIRKEETMRFDKATIVYVIQYFIKGHKFITKRSYSEFLYLYKEIKNDKPVVALPEMPPKKPILGKNEEVLQERKEAFDGLMKFLVQNQLGLEYLKAFLQTPNNLPYYGKISKKDSARLVPPNNSILSDGGHMPRYQPPQLANGQHGSFRSESNGNPSFLREAEDEENPQYHQRLYLLETVKVFRGEDKSIYYTIKICEKVSGEEANIIKRYRDFKTLHDLLKKTMNKKLRGKLPELPHKGPSGAFASADDPRVVGYRRRELPNYLQILLNTQEFAGTLAINDFVQSGMQ